MRGGTGRVSSFALSVAMAKGGPRGRRRWGRVAMAVLTTLLAGVVLLLIASSKKEADSARAAMAPPVPPVPELRFQVQPRAEAKKEEASASALDKLRERLDTSSTFKYAFPSEEQAGATDGAAASPGRGPAPRASEKKKEGPKGRQAFRERALNLAPIPRVSAGELSPEAFYAFNDKGRLPVIVEGEAKSHLASHMSFEDLKQLCGGGLTETSVYDPGTRGWAGLANKRAMTMAAYLDAHILNRTAAALPPEQRDLVYSSGAVGLPEFCPRLQFFTPVPKYVAAGVIPTDAHGVQVRRSLLLSPALSRDQRNRK